MTDKVYYKVVYIENGRMFSSFVDLEGLKVEYKYGEEISSPYGPLFVFRDIKWAKSFAWDIKIENQAVLQCVVKNPRRLPADLQLPWVPAMATEEWFFLLRRFWESVDSPFVAWVYPDIQPMAYQIPGTCLVDSLTLLEFDNDL